jgi:hypothetical protein
MIPASTFTKPVHILLATQHYGQQKLIVSTSIRGMIETLSQQRPDGEMFRTLDQYYTGRVVDYPRVYVDRIKKIREFRACDKWSHFNYRLFHTIWHSTKEGEESDVWRCSCVGQAKRLTKKFEPSCKICEDFEYLFKQESIPSLCRRLKKGESFDLPPVSSYKIGARIFQVQGGKHTNPHITYLPKLKDLEDNGDILFLFTGRRHDDVPLVIRQAYFHAAERNARLNADKRIADREVFRQKSRNQFTLLLQELGYDLEKATELAKKVP